MIATHDVGRGLGSRVLWSRRDIGDMFEGVLTTLGASFCAAYQRAVHPSCVRAMGVRDAGDPRLYFRIVDGHLYANVAYSAHLYSQTPLGRDLATFTRAFTSADVDAASYVNPYGAHRRAGGGRELLVWGEAEARALARVMRTLARPGREEPGVTFARVERFVRSRPGGEELRRAVDDAFARFGRAYAEYMPVVLNAFTLQAGATSAGRHWLDAESAALLVVATRAMLDPRREERDALRSLVTGADVDRFVARFGANGAREMDLAQPRWKDELPVVLAGVRPMPSPALPSARGAIASARTSLPRRAALLALVTALEAHAHARGRLRTRVVTRLWEVRALVFEVARRLSVAGALASIDAIASVKFDEVLASARGAPLPSAACLAARAREYERRLHLPPPPVSFVGEPPVRDARAHSSAESA